MSPGGIPVAGVADIAAMKIEAIASRGARKDFYDLYFICATEMSLAEAIRAFERRFASANPDLYHRLRAQCEEAPAGSTTSSVHAKKTVGFTP
jgi:predicted nucleotidyltransferase component of viral defense system